MSVTCLRDIAIAQNKKAQEEERRRLLRRIYHALSECIKQFSFDTAYIFGSVTKSGCFQENSDIDIGIEGIKADKFFKLKCFLEEYIEREIDLIDLSGVRFSKKIKEEGIKWKKVS